ncbi:putative baseplate assembly protein [Sorangium sp. So ce375]|uniref:putative baseplate assembly protein n=1 Tax=Sorangium sp. So ce375 TaxID=3133306 RepID=UPI003F5B6ECA
MQSPDRPLIAGAPHDDIAARTEKLAQALSPWRPPAGDAADPGRALIRVFDRMARHALERLNRVPERSFVAFLNLVGVEPTPPRPARVPLTFTLVQRSSAEPVVPEGTRVGAAAVPGDTREIVFETERELATTRAELKAVFVRDPDGDRYADRTAAAAGAGFYDALAGDRPVEHALYLADDAILGAPAGTPVTVTLEIAAAERARFHALHALALPPLAGDAAYQQSPPEPPLVSWSYWNGAGWQELVCTPSLDGGSTTAWNLGFAIPADMAATTVAGRTARFLRADLVAWPLDPIPQIQAVRMRAEITWPAAGGIAPDLALAIGRKADLSLDFRPLGERPRVGDTFYVASAAVLSRAGAQVTVTVTPSPAMAPLRTTEDPTLAWEVSTASGWVRVVSPDMKKTGAADATFPSMHQNNAIHTVTFTLPANVAPAEVLGKQAYWLRIRLVQNDYGKGIQVGSTITDDGYRPPILAALSLRYTQTVTSNTPFCVSRDDFALVEHQPGAAFAPWRRLAAGRAIYFGFNQPFANRDNLLYLQVEPISSGAALLEAPGGAPAKLVWEYATAAAAGGIAAGDDALGWKALFPADETRDLAQSGLVAFIGPTDLAPCARFGQELFWLRARLAEGSFAVSPRLGRVLTNTVWATHATTIKGEVLGSSDGGAGLTFALSHRPVLEGQRIEVLEPAAPPPEERAELERLEGPDAVRAVGAPGGAQEIWVRWHEVQDFHGSGPRDRHYRLDRRTGEVRFGDGQRGMAPPRGVRSVRAAVYRAGGGADGNRPAGALTQLKTTVAYVDGALNHEPATAGTEWEADARVAERGPRVLRHRGRGVTAEDIEDLAREASPAVARARAITPRFSPFQLAELEDDDVAFEAAIEGGGHVTVLVVPSSPEVPPRPSMGLLMDVEDYLRRRSPATAALRVVGPEWLKVSAHVRLVPATLEGVDDLRGRVLRALTDFLHPLTGAPGGVGWQFGELPHVSDIYRLLFSIAGVESVISVDLTETPLAGDPEDAAWSARALVYSGSHAIEIV